jgi:transcriptional regulator with XRE-family HTH domain
MSSKPRALAQAIREARAAQGLTQGELAARIGVSQGAVSFWENGAETPKIEHVIGLALEFPELLRSFDGRERQLLDRVLRLERGLGAGRCACAACACGKDRS